MCAIAIVIHRILMIVPWSAWSQVAMGRIRTVITGTVFLGNHLCQMFFDINRCKAFIPGIPDSNGRMIAETYHYIFCIP